MEDNDKMDLSSAIEESEKCKYCKVAECSNVCPLKVDIKKVLSNISSGNYKEAYDELLLSNILPEYTSYLCQERPLCINECINAHKRKTIFKHNSTFCVYIPLIERFLAYYHKDYYNKSNDENFNSNKKVAIIGSGSAGISCARVLINNGFSVSLYERENFIGQDLRVGLLNSNIANQIVDEYEKEFVEKGMNIYKNQSLNFDFDILKLKRDYNYLVITSNFADSNALNISGETSAFSSPSNDVLHLVCYTKDFVKLTNRNEYFKKDDKVIIVGTSNVSIDTARIAHKFSDDVTVSFINNSKSLGLRNDEIEKSEIKNINIVFNAKPVKIQIANRKVMITYRKTKNTYDEHMRPILEEVFDTEWTDTCDHLIIDSSSTASINEELMKLPGVSLRKDMTVLVDENNIATNDGSVFCCGELAGEETNFMNQIKSGMKIANVILRDSSGEFREYRKDYKDQIKLKKTKLFDIIGDDTDE